ncbi:MAG: glycosyltransferase family 9 protein [Bdellovibrionales bacterium]
MRTLFVSFLRLGDLILQRPLIESSAEENEVHVLINDEFKSVANLYPQFKFHFFPRRQLQQVINQPETSLLEPFEILRRFTKELNSNQFDQVINLTHNRLSAYLLDQLEAPVKKGLQYQGDRFQAFENPWQVYFNETFSAPRRSEVHYLAALAKSLDLAIPRIRPVERRSPQGPVYFQIFTSDEKKNWSLANWKELSTRLKAVRRDLSVKILCSESEALRLKAYFQTDELEIADLVTAREKLKSAQLLICGDTSVAHLAAEVQTPTLVLSLGSSDATKTMPWSHGNWILTANVPCAPCPHSNPCQRDLHECGQALRVGTVLRVASGLLRDQMQFSIALPEQLFRSELDTKLGFKLVHHSQQGGQDVSKLTDVF